VLAQFGDVGDGGQLRHLMRAWAEPEMHKTVIV